MIAAVATVQKAIKILFSKHNEMHILYPTENKNKDP